MRSEYGPEVYCPESADITESTWRPAGDTGPFFCMACGATDHTPAE